MKPKYDMLWKGMIEEIMEDLLLFVEPEIGKALDLSRGFEFLDKELAELYPEPEGPANTRVVDKLVKTYLRDGTERWMLLHIEVQGSNAKGFANRMFEYYIRVYSKHQRPVAAIGRRKTEAMLTFLNNYVVFKNPKINRNFMAQTDQILGKTNPMGIVEQLVEIKHQEGKQEGKLEGIQEGLEKAIRGLLTNTDFSAKKIAESVGVPLSVVTKVKKQLGTK